MAEDLYEVWVGPSMIATAMNLDITFVYSNDIYNAPTVIPADKDGEI